MKIRTLFDVLTHWKASIQRIRARMEASQFDILGYVFTLPN